MSDSLWPHGLYSPWNSPGQNTGVGSCSLLQEIFPTQGLNPGLLHCRLILYQLSHQGSPRILEWVACPFSSGSFQPRNQPGVSCIAGRFFTSWAIREALTHLVDTQILAEWINELELLVKLIHSSISRGDLGYHMTQLLKTVLLKFLVYINDHLEVFLKGSGARQDLRICIASKLSWYHCCIYFE